MNLGIVGLPQVGKRSVFELLTGRSADKAPRRDGLAFGTAPVRDQRIDALSGMYQPKRTRYAEFEIALAPDVQPDTARSAAWLEPLRRVDALVHVVRAFDAPHVFHVEESVEPERDLRLVRTELLLADLELVETRLGRMAKDSRGKSDAAHQLEKTLLVRCHEHLEAERPLRALDLIPEHGAALRHLQFFTLKPSVVVLNTGDDVRVEGERLAAMAGRMSAADEPVVLLSAPIESELSELDDADLALFMQELGVDEPASHRLSRAAYECLGLISFFTVGPDEVRAWSVPAGFTAPEAAGRIHSDLQRGFIRADTIPDDVLTRHASEREARAAHGYRLEGKDYVVSDGDVMEIRFSV